MTGGLGFSREVEEILRTESLGQTLRIFSRNRDRLEAN